MYVEDAHQAQGPITLIVSPSITVAELKLQVEQQFEIPVAVQKWILDKSLVSEDGVTLSSQGVDKDGARIYLYLVSPEEQKEAIAAPAPTAAAAAPALPVEPMQKGRYWNYEEDRWSVCNSEDEDEVVEPAKPANVKFIPAPKDVKAALEAVQEEENVGAKAGIAGAKAGIAGASAGIAGPKAVEEVTKADVPRPENGKEEEGEWEYYYEEEQEKPKENEKAKKPNIENIVANHLLEKRKAVVHEEAPKVEAAKEEAEAGWQCPVCTLMNPLERPGCQACTTERPADLGAAATQEEVQQVQQAGNEVKKENNLDAYKQLENLDIIPNAETFECAVCFLDIEPGDGVVLRECLHSFCK